MLHIQCWLGLLGPGEPRGHLRPRSAMSEIFPVSMQEVVEEALARLRWGSHVGFWCVERRAFLTPHRHVVVILLVICLGGECKNTVEVLPL